ncbi:MAG: nucleoside 2-deoxyribosyltransferase, partial [Comamonadaceae bacterium]
LAGPDVFLPDAAQAFARLKAQCAACGLEGIAPTDTDHGADSHPHEEASRGADEALAQRIYEGNVRLIQQADGVIANLQPFRGLEPDSGTVFEVGYAVALGKPVVAYGVPESTYQERVSAAIACTRGSDGVVREQASGLMVEGLGQRLNLMITRSSLLEPTAQDALRRLATVLGVSSRMLLKI